jgi:O-antigen ligase
VLRRTPFDVPLALFVMAAGVGVWLAYDPAPAWPKLIVILAGVALYYALVFLPRRLGHRDTTRVIFAAAPAVIFGYFLLTADLSYRLGKIPLLDPLMQLVMLFQPRIGLPEMNTNTLGGLMAVLLPLQFHAVFANLTGRVNLTGLTPSLRFGLSGLKSPRAWLGIALLLLSLFALVLSASRAGWLALAVVALFVLLHSALRRFVVGAKQREAPVINKDESRFPVALPLLTVFAFALILAGVGLLFGERIAQTIASDRAPIWSTGFQLATDYPFTGLGLASFSMPYSSYTLLTHVPFHNHAHNLYLDLWLETGLLGVFAFGMMSVVAFRAPMRDRAWRTASLAAISVMLLHGALDDPLFAYGLPGQLFMWLPFVAVAREAQPAYVPLKAPLVFAGASAAVAALLMAFVPPAQAAWQANLGALTQNRIELPDYHYEKWGLQDNLRRSGAIDLTPAIAHYRQALALDRSNATANRRLGQIELANGEYDRAMPHVQAAFATTPGFRASRQLQGEALAVEDRLDEAAALWRSIDAAQGQLQQRLDWYLYFMKDDVRAGRIAAVLKRLQPAA